MLNVRVLGNKIQNIILEYNDVEISIAVKEHHEDGEDLYKLEIDSVMLTHSEKGNISTLYTRGDDGLIYPEVNITTELQRIFKFIDEFNRIV